MVCIQRLRLTFCRGCTAKTQGEVQTNDRYTGVTYAHFFRGRGETSLADYFELKNKRTFIATDDRICTTPRKE
jgi:hypothetical protein